MNQDLYEKLIVKPGAKIDLDAIDTDPGKLRLEKTEMKIRALENSRQLLRHQFELYSENEKSLLIVLQALDAGGKDGVINHVLAAMNPQGCRSRSFKTPTAIEAAHDFLWRIHMAAPAKGEVVIFNRSHYEDVLVARVHQLVPKEVWKKRYERINEFEKLLASSGTRIVKFFLHISPNEQLKRFGARIADPEKHWKLSNFDFKERALWDEYTAAFEEAMEKCSTEHAPWFIIPADDKDFRDFATSEILVRTFEEMKIQVPKPKVDMDAIRIEYEAELAKQKKKSRRSK